MAFFVFAKKENNPSSNSGQPEFPKNSAEDFKLLKPWDYDNNSNSQRYYPLVVGLHGLNGTYYMPSFVNNDQQRQAYPMFYMAPHTNADWISSSRWLIDQIEVLRAQYRIDSDRIYLIGFSMGGSGAYAVANAYYDYKKQLFAGIVRMAGQSQTEVRMAIAEKTSIWYHVGLDDEPVRVNIARQAYKFIKDYPSNASAEESVTTDKTLGGYTRITKTLKKNKVEIMKLSEYQNVGHTDMAFKEDLHVLKWLFSQSLRN